MNEAPTQNTPLEICPLCGGTLTIQRKINWFEIWIAIIFPPIGFFVLAANGLTRKQVRCVRCPWGQAA